MAAAGLEVEVDPDGNLLGRLVGTEPELPEVWSGSHLDSVPQGGRLDGPLGVLGALEALERLGPRQRTLVVVAFREEERGCVGSQARVGRGGLPGAWLELHHEQGPRLALAEAPLGLVTSIVGYKRAERVIDGRAGHAGTTPMDVRDDALVKAAEEVLRIRDVALGIEGAVATVGRLEVEPGGVNVIPGRVRLTIDARLQFIAERELRAAVEEHGALGGTVVMMDPHTGEILALVSEPHFNPNDSRKVDRNSRINRAVETIYEPG